MKTTVIALVAVASLATACTSYKEVVSSYVGASEGELITQWGVPDQTYRGDDGVRYLSYRRARNYDAMGTTLHGRCVTTFKVEDGKITSASYQGNDCR
jgi:hypothetical protein